jgi:cytidine deaminase
MKTLSREALEEPFASALPAVEQALARSHCPCSNLCVAAGWVLSDGRVITGINYESASYGLTLCAERSALTRAQAEGDIEMGIGIILAAAWKEEKAEAPPLTPCGACRQWLAELSHRLGKDFPVYSFWKNSGTGIESTARELLPDSFDMKDLSSD